MSGIHVLSPHIANQIAAGEVVERPSSVVKELVENAVDAHASAITIEIENGGIDRIAITDNGIGIPDADCETAFLRHATSKISTTDDLTHIATLGFRGEALASIAAVSRVTLTTATAIDELGTFLRYDGGVRKEHRRVGGAVGTRIEVENLFFNVPARLKFLKSIRAESGAIGDAVARLILSLPQVAFHFVNNGKSIYRSTGDGSLLNALVAIYGVEIVPQLCKASFDDGYLKIDGYVGTPELSRPNRMAQSFFLNGRTIRSNALSAALSRAFDTRLLIGRYPFAALAIQIALAEVDVNVHPAKLEVRFIDESRVTRSVCVACSEALLRSYVPEARLETKSTVSDGITHSNADSAETPVLECELPRMVDLRQPVLNASFGVREAAMAKSWRMDAASTAEESAFRPIPGTQNSLFTTRGVSGESEPLMEPYSVIGVAFRTYWFVEQGEAIYCIDQHAAHERLLYDALSNRTVAIVSQALLEPEEITLDAPDYALYCEKKSALESFGYVFADARASENHVTIAAVPQLNGVALRGAFLLDRLHERDISRALLTQSACKHAIKAGEPITGAELRTLLTALTAGETLLTCPHGRPVAVRITRLELEKLFKRVL